MAEPFENGLGVDETREIVYLLGSGVVGAQLGVVLMGPLDVMKSEAAADVLLKTLEEYNPDAVLPVMWAMDAGNVRSTIRSRCLEVWCPHGADPYLGLEDQALGLCRAALTREWSSIIETLKDWEKTETDTTKRAENRRMLLSACAGVLSEATKRGLGWRPLWLSIRKTLQYKNISKGELLSALLVGAG